MEIMMNQYKPVDFGVTYSTNPLDSQLRTLEASICDLSLSRPMNLSKAALKGGILAAGILQRQVCPQHP